MSDERAFDPIPLKVPEEEFMVALSAFLFQFMDVPPDGKWREVVLQFDIRSETAEQSNPDMGGFLLGGRSAG